MSRNDLASAAVDPAALPAWLVDTQPITIAYLPVPAEGNGAHTARAR